MKEVKVEVRRRVFGEKGVGSERHSPQLRKAGTSWNKPPTGLHHEDNVGTTNESETIGYWNRWQGRYSLTRHLKS